MGNFPFKSLPKPQDIKTAKAAFVICMVKFMHILQSLLNSSWYRRYHDSALKTCSYISSSLFYTPYGNKVLSDKPTALKGRQHSLPKHFFTTITSRYFLTATAQCQLLLPTPPRFYHCKYQRMLTLPKDSPHLTACHVLLASETLGTNPARATLPFTSLPNPQILDSKGFICYLHGEIHASLTSPREKTGTLKTQILMFQYREPSVYRHAHKTIPHTCRKSDHWYFLMSHTYVTCKSSIQSFCTR